MNTNMLEKYARLLVKSGINLKKEQILVINSPIECAEFARMIARIAYDEGAGDVVIYWRDELFAQIRYMKAPDRVFDQFPNWQKEFYESYAEQGAAFLSIFAEDPELLKDVNPERIARSQKTRSTALKAYYDRTMKNMNVWCVASIPTRAWASKVFPGLTGDQAVERLWEEIFKTVRADAEDPVEAWNIHKKNLKKSLDYLNSNNFKYLNYKNSLGTDLVIELPEGHVWVGGSDFTPDGHEFIANMPTEEVFTLPLKTGVNGTVVSSIPLNYNGNLIEGFTIKFKDGRITEYKAEKGSEILKSIIETDEGSHFLGEVALVPVDSPISASKILYYNTLFDENASCHLAIGKAYPSCLRNGDKLSEQELEAAGANESLQHEDFMIGTADLQITGITRDGRELPIFRNGKYAF